MPLPNELDPLTLAAVNAEVIRARIKFPDPEHLLAALMEEVGELAKALLEDAPRDDMEREALQVAAVALRMVEEGDADFALSRKLLDRARDAMVRHEARLAAEREQEHGE